MSIGCTVTKAFAQTSQPIEAGRGRPASHFHLPRARSTVLAPSPEQPSSSGGRCPCGGGCPNCQAPSSSSRFSSGQALPAGLRSRAEAVQGVDFSGVRVHRDAPDVTGPLHARAVTRGQDIYFRPGEFQPDTPPGQRLIAHELAHTRQTRPPGQTSEQPASFVSRPGDALERNAAALARGVTAHAMAAPAGAALRSPLPGESATDQTRRESLVESINHGMDTILRLLRTGGLIETIEVPTERGGVRGVVYGGSAGTPDEEFVSYADRDVRLRRIVRNLMAMARLYRTTAIPAEFTAPVEEEIEIEGPQGTTRGTHFNSTIQTPEGSSSYGGKTPEWADLQSAYERYRRSQGQIGDEYQADWYYLDPEARITPGTARGAPRIGGGIPIGAYMVFPDLDNEPLRYWRLDGFNPTPRGSTIVEFWHDDFGYYYTHRGQRIDVPSPWSH